ncbi:hypothetical protein [Sphingomonas abietis]|uniref:Uncharacterized protein n=1 Tax=Sphingomonas abietis TaxID=3012344 RepID=A0ABY7NLC2_9SPHN|nr:hypothetical protein [Sphingomonas abietis]WBO21271.1 hypothetical protein PBT88_13860 [Sphingomonas abietis]
MRLMGLPLLALIAAASPNADSTPRDACIKASGMDDAATSAPVHFSDRSALDVLMVTGRYPPRVNKGRAGTMLCLYDRRTKMAQTRDAGAWSRTPQP